MSLVALLAGALVGVVLGALGGGGAIIAVPILIYLLGMPPHEATTASLVIVGVSAAIAATAHARAGGVRVWEGLLFAGIGTLGTWAGSVASALVDPEALLLAFAALLLVVAFLMWRQSGAPARAGDDPAALIRWTRPRHCDCRRVATVALAAIGVGLLTGLFGVGGGFAIVPALVLVLGLAMPTAVGTSLLVMAVNSATALAVRLGSGTDIDWTVTATFTATAVAGSLVGSRITRRVRPELLQRSFAALLVVVAGYMGFRLVTG